MAEPVAAGGLLVYHVRPAVVLAEVFYMWIFLNDSFLSIVTRGQDPHLLLVRGRCKGDIERVFPQASVEETPKADYRFRAVIPREEVSQALTRAVMEIDYGNFKNSVRERDRHDVYAKCWSNMYALQVERLRNKRQRAKDREP
jgi:hypothetical protein